MHQSKDIDWWKHVHVYSSTYHITLLQFSSVQSLCCVWLFATPWTAAHQASLSISNSQSIPKLMSIESVMPSNHFILCHPFLLPLSIFPRIRVFSNESVLLHQVAKVLELQLQHQSFQRKPWFPLGLIGLISLLSKRFSRVFFSTTIQKHQLFSAHLYLWSHSYIHTYELILSSFYSLRKIKIKGQIIHWERASWLNIIVRTSTQEV